MKILKKIFTAAALLISAGVNAQVNFIINDWEKATTIAKESNKYIFMDCYTDWCSWCKVMDKETFTDNKVTEVLNSDMVSVKMDMEKGVGVQLAMKYGVSAFPSTLVFNSNGMLIYRSMGYEKPESFLKTIENTRNINEPLPGYTANMNLTYPDFYKTVFDKTKKSPYPKEAEVYAFLDKQDDLTNEVSWNVLKRFTVYGKYQQKVLDNIEVYTKYFGKNDVDAMVGSILSNKLKTAIKNKNEDELNLVIELSGKYFPEDAEQMSQNYSARFYLETGNCASYSRTIETIIANNKDIDAGQLNSYSWNVYEKCDDPASIKLAIGWIERAVNEEPLYAYLDTYAAVLYKAKDYDKAKVVAIKAIETGKKDKEDVKETEALLEKINAAMAK